MINLERGMVGIDLERMISEHSRVTYTFASSTDSRIGSVSFAAVQ